VTRAGGFRDSAGGSETCPRIVAHPGGVTERAAESGGGSNLEESSAQ